MREITFNPEALPSQQNYDQIDYLMQCTVHERINSLFDNERRLEWAQSYCYIDDKLVTDQEADQMIRFLGGLAQLIKFAVDLRTLGDMCAPDTSERPFLELVNPMVDWSRADDLVARLASLLVLESVKVKPHKTFLEQRQQQEANTANLLQTDSMVVTEIVEKQPEEAARPEPTLHSLDKGMIGIEILGWDVHGPSIMSYRTTTVYFSDVEGRVLVDGFSLD